MISIIICTLNEELYLPKLLDSLLAQEGIPFEIILVDAGSEDATQAVFEQYRLRTDIPMHFLDMSQNRGIAAQRNAGAEQAKYERLLFLDADVVLPKGFLKKAVSQLERRGINLAGTRIYAAEKSPFYRFAYWAYSNFYLPFMRLFNPVLHGCSIFSTKYLHAQVGGFRPGVLFEDFKYAADAKAYARSYLLRGTYVRTSARRFYSTSARGLLELAVAGVYSIFKAGIADKKHMKAYESTTGHHAPPKY